MRLLIVLDTSPLGLLASPAKTSAALEADRWLQSHLEAGNKIFVPAVADFEIRRELERASLIRSLARLDQFNAEVAGRYLSLTDADLLVAARFWAQARNRGTPTADSRELDCDVLIAAQAHALTQFGEVVVATTNVGHLGQFVRAARYTEVTP